MLYEGEQVFHKAFYNAKCNLITLIDESKICYSFAGDTRQFITMLMTANKPSLLVLFTQSLLTKLYIYSGHSAENGHTQERNTMILMTLLSLIIQKV